MMGDSTTYPKPLRHALDGHRVPYFVLKLMSSQALLSLGWVAASALTENDCALSALLHVEASPPPEHANEKPELLDPYVREQWQLRRSYVEKATRCTAYVAEMDRQVEQNLCNQCSGKNPCQGTADSSLADSIRLTERGACIRTFLDTLRYAEELAQNCYKKFLADVALSTVPLVLGVTEQRQHCVNRAVFGLCKENRSMPRHVRLELNITAFKWTDYVASFAVAFHEYFVHAWGATEIQNQAQCDSFHDGWMQYTGMLLLNEHLNRLSFSDVSPSSVPELIQQNVFEYLSTAELLDRARRDRQTGNSHATPWKIAHDSAKVVHQWFVSLFSESAKDLFTIFSLALNTSCHFTDDERHALAANSRWVYDKDRINRLSHDQLTAVLVALEKLTNLGSSRNSVGKSGCQSDGRGGFIGAGMN